VAARLASPLFGLFADHCADRFAEARERLDRLAALWIRIYIDLGAARVRHDDAIARDVEFVGIAERRKAYDLTVSDALESARYPDHDVLAVPSEPARKLGSKQIGANDLELFRTGRHFCEHRFVRRIISADEEITRAVVLHEEYPLNPSRRNDLRRPFCVFIDRYVAGAVRRTEDVCGSLKPVNVIALLGFGQVNVSTSFVPSSLIYNCAFGEVPNGAWKTEAGCAAAGVMPALPLGDEHAASVKIDAARSERVTRSTLRKNIGLLSLNVGAAGDGADWLAESTQRLEQCAFRIPVNVCSGSIGIRDYNTAIAHGDVAGNATYGRGTDDRTATHPIDSIRAGEEHVLSVPTGNAESLCQ
jgi:hypothetical protein